MVRRIECNVVIQKKMDKIRFSTNRFISHFTFILSKTFVILEQLCKDYPVVTCHIDLTCLETSSNPP